MQFYDNGVCMKFIHCADLHLDSKIETLPAEKSKTRRYEILRSFERLSAYAEENGVTAVIIAGDMFDTGRVTAKTAERVLRAIEGAESVDFLYLSGNHDDDNFISKLEYLPKNLKVFNDTWTTYSYGNVNIGGIKLTPTNSGAVYDGLSLDENSLNIVVMHGQIAGYKSDEAAEIISIPRLREKNIDYLALGHIHSFCEGDIDNRGKYAYSGCLDGRGFDETGEKGFVLIETDDKKIKTEFVSFSSRRLYEFEFDVGGETSFYSLSEKILNFLYSNCTKNDVVKVVLKGEHEENFDIDKDGLSARLNEELFYAKIYDKTELKINIEDYLLDKSVRGEFVRSVWESDMDNLTKQKVIMCGINALKGEDF